MFTDIHWFLLAGLFAGIFSGLLGIGGGVITVPALYYIFAPYGFPPEEIMRMAVGTALAATFLTSVGSAWAHHKKIGVSKKIFQLMAPALLIGCILGALLADFLHGAFLKIIFGCMLLLFALYFSFPKLPPLSIAPQLNRSLSLLCLLFGVLSALLGIGGGIFMVPTFLGYHLSLRNAIAASAVGTLISALVGSLTYLVIGWGNSSLPYMFGYIQIPAFLTIGLSSFCTSFLGVKLSHILPTDRIKQLFALALGVTGIAMVFGK